MTTTISKDAIELAKAYVRRSARPLDVALLDYRLGVGSEGAILSELASFQNDDGGFGHGLEPDLATPASSAIATSIAFQHLGKIGAPANAEIVRRGLAWLEMNFEWEDGVWPLITAEVDLAPHAPWWNYVGNFRERANGFRYNPSAELLSVLYRYREAASPALLERAQERFLAALNSAGPTESYDLRCAVRLLETPEMPEIVRRPLEDAVLDAIRQHDANDPHAPFLELAPTPRSPVAKAFRERIEPAIAALIAEQAPDGRWGPFWEWGEVDAAAWQIAERAWRGLLTRQAIETLISYDVIHA